MQRKNQEICFPGQAGDMCPCEPNPFDSLQKTLRILLHACQRHGESPMQLEPRSIGAMVVPQFMTLPKLCGQCVCILQVVKQGGKFIARAQNQILSSRDVTREDDDV